MDKFETYSDAEILRQAEALRSEMIRSFISALFQKREQTKATAPINAVPAE